MPRVRFVDKLRIVAGCVVAIGLMRYLGWMVAGPKDPEMGLTLAVGTGIDIGSWVAILVLSLVSSVLGTAISGRRLREAGLLVGCVGLAAMAQRAGTMQDVLGYHAGIEESSRQALMIRLLLDTALWGAILVANWLAVMFVYGWLWLPGGGEAAIKNEAPSPAANGEGAKPGWMATGATTIAALFMLNATLSRTDVTPILRGQTIGVLILGMMLLVMLVRYFVGVHESRWYLGAPLFVAVVAYVMGYVNADMTWTQGEVLHFRHLATTPPHTLARVLPVEYVSMATIGVILGFWSGEKIEEVAESELA